MTERNEISARDNEERAQILGLFLDPDGDNFDEFQNTILGSIKLLRLWWKGPSGSSSALRSDQENEDLAAIYDQQLISSPFPKEYAQLGPLIKALFKNLRFNKNNMANVHPSPLLPAIAASFVATIQNPNNLSPSTSPATSSMEEECIRQLAAIVGFPEKRKQDQAGGNILSCGTLSNLTALMVAREKADKMPGRSSKKTLNKPSFLRDSRGIIAASQSSHYSIRKAAKVLGLGDNSVVEVPVAEKSEIREFEKSGTPFRLKPSKEVYAQTFERIGEMTNKNHSKGHTIISAVSTLGTVNTGTIEPVRPLLELRNEFGFHLHVDAAIGGLALGLDQVKAKASGVEYADSITIDPHKLGFIHYPCSAIIFRNKSDLKTIAIDAPYLDSCASTIEGSRPGSSSAAFWVALKTLGRNGYDRVVGSCIDMTKILERLLLDAGFQVLHEVDLNTVCFSIHEAGQPRKRLNRLTSDLHARVNAKGSYLLGKVDDISGIRIRDRPWQTDSETVSLTGIKAWIMNPYTEEEDMDTLVNELSSIRKELYI